MKKSSASNQDRSASDLITNRIAELGDWRGKTLGRIRALIKDADPDVVEEWKWAKATSPGVPVWSHDGIICTGESYKSVVKLTFAKGAALKDPAGLFNSSLEGNVRRAIDIREGETLDASAFKALVREVVAVNTSGKSKARSVSKAKAASRPGVREAPVAGVKPKLLSGGNPQIAKADGDAPVQAYIEAMPGWKRDVGRRLDALVVRTLPKVKKAVRWNSPFYGVEGQGWFLSFHCFTSYIKVTFLRGTSLRPMPPVESKDPNTRYFHIHEGDQIDEKLVAGWIRQASKMPGDPLF
jgi:hypothetical protein